MSNRLLILPLALLIGPVELINCLVRKDSIIGSIYDYKKQIERIRGRRDYRKDRNNIIMNTIVLLICLVSSVIWALLFAKFSLDCFRADLYIQAVFLALPTLLLAFALMSDTYFGIKMVSRINKRHRK